MKKTFFSIIIIIFSLSPIFALPSLAASASLYLTPATGTYAVGSKFTVGVNVNTGGVSVNAGQGTINFDQDLLKVVGVSKAGSVFSLWTSEPGASGNNINFGGGVPNPGYTGSGGRVINITFQAIKAGTAQVRFSTGYVLANDGKGTNILSSMGSANFTISPKDEAPVEKPKDIPKKEEPKEQAAYIRPEIKSETHPDENKWYNNKRAKFNWVLPEIANGVSILFDKKEVSDPGPASDGIFDSKEYEIAEDGHWYLHVKFEDKQGRWGTIDHFRINSDTVPPKPFSIEVKQEDPNDFPTLFFETSDELSGLDRYEVSIDDLQTEPIIIEVDKKSLKVSEVEIGEHTVVVRAVDKAGNEIFSSAKFEVIALAAPIIKEYPKEITPEDKFFVSGIATPDAIITISIKKEGEDKINAYKTESDKGGNWFFVVNDKLSNGQYIFWAEAENIKGIKSKPSNKLSFLVTPPVFTRVGSFVINYFTVITSLLFVIVLIIFFILLIVQMLRKRLKKETFEIESVLERNMDYLEKEINSELDALGKLSKTDYLKEKTSAKKRLAEKLSDTNKKILKEVKDVEKILK